MLTHNLLSEQHSTYISDILTGDRFPYYYSTNLNSSGYTNKFDDDITALGFAHKFFDNGTKQSDGLELVMPYLFSLLDRNNLKLDTLLRVRSALTIPTGRQHKGFPHVDLTGVSGYKTAIIYVAGNDGDTILYNEMFDGRILPESNELTELCRIRPMPNSGFIFDGHRYHTGLLPEISKIRLVLNFNFTTDESNFSACADGV